MCLGVEGLHVVREHLAQVSFLLPLWVSGVELLWLGKYVYPRSHLTCLRLRVRQPSILFGVHRLMHNMSVWYLFMWSMKKERADNPIVFLS